MSEILNIEDIINEEKKIIEGKTAIITKTIQYNEDKVFELNFKMIGQETLFRIRQDYPQINKITDKSTAEDIFNQMSYEELEDFINTLLSKSWIKDPITGKTFTKTELKNNLSFMFKMKIITIIMEESGFTKDKMDFIVEH